MVGHTNTTVFTEDRGSQEKKCAVLFTFFYNSYARKIRQSYSAKWEPKTNACKPK